MTTREDCAALDARDPLAPYRARFALPEAVIYLDGNSLGALPVAAAERAARVIGGEWGDGLIRSWNDADWVDLPFKVGDRIAALIGAEAGEVVACDSTSVNLFKLLAAAFALRPKRHVVVTDSDNFPTDNYIAEGVGEFLGPRVERRLVAGDRIIDAIDEDTAVVSLTHVNYRTGRIHDMAAISAAAAAHGALSLWDLSHSAGAVPPAAQRLDGPCRAVRLFLRLPPGAGHRAHAFGHAAGDRAGGFRERPGYPRRGRHGGAQSQIGGAQRAFHGTHRSEERRP